MYSNAGLILSGLIRCAVLLPSVFLIAVLAGCTTVHGGFTPYTPQSAQGGVPVRAAIVLPDALCSYHYDNGNLTAFDLGPTLCANARRAAEAVFSQTVFYRDPGEINAADFDIVGTLRPGRVRTHGTRQIPATVSADVDLEWSFRTADGTRQYQATIRGRGEDTRTYGMADIRYQSSMQRCMDDLAANLRREMAGAAAKADSNATATEQIRTAVQGLKVGSTSLASYRTAMTQAWAVYMIDEQVKYNGSQYGYRYDPAAKLHDSFMGSCTTHWASPWPVIDALRPSVSLAQSDIDRTRISGFRLRELVGSAYDNHPLCELVFQGDSFANAVLTQRSCDGDFVREGAYASFDSTRKPELNETARQWLKLRVGMTKQEIGALAGVPVQIIHSNLTGWLYEYGHGRIELDHHERLQFWQLRELPSVLEQRRAGMQMPGCLAD
jgi:hypothetical protein